MRQDLWNKKTKLPDDFVDLIGTESTGETLLSGEKDARGVLRKPRRAEQQAGIPPKETR